jgi:hypothetical protein
MGIVPFIVHLISDAAGGNFAGELLKKFSLWILSSSNAGAPGSGLGSQLLSMLTGAGADVALRGLEIGSILSGVAGVVSVVDC